MTTDIQDTLLALHLALYGIKNPLSEKERQSLNNIGEQLLYPEHWDIIKANLTKIINGNQEWERLHKESLARIESYGGDYPPAIQEILDKMKEETLADNNEPREFRDPRQDSLPNSSDNGTDNTEYPNAVWRQYLTDKEPDKKIKENHLIQDLFACFFSQKNNIKN